jgi:hypothetical protein
MSCGLGSSLGKSCPAGLAIIFIFSIHLINSHLRPGCFPMDTTIFTGVVTERESKETHANEYQRAAEGKLKEKLTTKRLCVL